MTVPTTTRLVEYDGDDTLTVFAYPFKVYAAGDMVVTLIDAVAVETIQTLGVHYTISGLGLPSGGNVTMVTAPATGETLRIERTPPILQQTDLRNQGTYLPSNVEDALDKIVMMIQAIAGGSVVISVDDEDAIHDNVAGEIMAIDEKASPVTGDVMLIEDSESGYLKKRVPMSAVAMSQWTVYTAAGKPAATAGNAYTPYIVKDTGVPAYGEIIYETASAGVYGYAKIFMPFA